MNLIQHRPGVIVQIVDLIEFFYPRELDPKNLQCFTHMEMTINSNSGFVLTTVDIYFTSYRVNAGD